jgi:serine/threonine-protein kinase
VRPDGRAIDARSDEFSLGATLYECLAWRRPFEGDNVQAVVDAITREDPPHPRSIRPSVPADLGLIALKALEKRREDRYGSMRELEQDLERFVAHVPIMARAPSPARRAQKWMLRHPTASATIGLSLLAFAALLVMTLRLARTNAELLAAQAETERQAEAARNEAALSREVEDFLTGLFRSASPDLYGHEELTLRDVVERGRARIRAGEVERPEVRARLATTLADVLAKLGDFGEASDLLDEAAAIWKELGLEQQPHAQATHFSQAVAAYDAGRDPEALAIVEELQALEGRLDPALALQLARVRGEVLTRQGRFADAEVAFQEAEDRFREQPPQDSDERVLLRMRRAELDLRQARFAEGERILAEDSARLEPLLAQGNPLVLDHFNVLALLWQGQQRLEEAQRLFERLVSASEEHLGRDHARSINFRGNLAIVLQARGEIERAETMLAECCDLGEARYGHDSTEAASARHNLANCLAQQKRYAEAEPMLRDLLADMEKNQGVHHQLTVRTRASLAYSLIALRKSKEAAELLELVLVDFPEAAPERPAIESALAKLRSQLGAEE